MLLPIFPLHQHTTGHNEQTSVTLQWANFCNIAMNSYRVIRFETEIIGQNLYANMEVVAETVTVMNDDTYQAHLQTDWCLYRQFLKYININNW